VLVRACAECSREVAAMLQSLVDGSLAVTVLHQLLLRLT
jgi:hypothetical protein